MAGTYLSKRSIDGPDPRYAERTYNQPVTTGEGLLSSIFPCRQSTTSFRSRGDDFSTLVPDTYTFDKLLNELNEPQTSSKRGAGRGFSDSGHPFSTVKTQLFLSHENYYVGGALGTWYHGPIWPSRPAGSPSSASMQIVPAINTSYYGPLAIKNTTPTHPVANVTGAAFELVRDGLPGGVISKTGAVFGKLAKRESTKLSTTSLQLMQAAAGDYLNFQFAITPLLGDLSKIFHAVVESQKTLDQLYRDTGRNVRRRYNFPRERTTQTLVESVNTSFAVNEWASGFITHQSLFAGYDPGQPSLPQNPSGATARSSVTLSQEETYWFSGAYTYYFGDEDNNLGSKINVWARDADKILGLGVTPEVLWNAAPWSWLLDWSVNIGDNITNYTNFSQDGLVLRYGYLMRKNKRVYTFTTSGVRFYTSTPGTINAKYVITTKERVKATPFGFGSNPNSWTARQWAILASLGMTRSPRVAF